MTAGGGRDRRPPAPRAAAVRPIPNAGAEDAAEPEGEVVGLDLGRGGAEATRGGEDARRRGWFWHWNSVVTQFAPLIGLKGVGLLNSYTVWTDRREESPHRGYAFPSQQSEADFYGEDRAELIAINKILVALDLIEIRKEMVLRADEQGRRWRVPHNFYRVKDHADGFGLSARDVLRVAELADRDKAVYRYVRRVFSPRFAPIDGDNPWHRILPELRRTELWQRLAARAAAEEDRASARTRAGHASRRSATTASVDGVTALAALDPSAPAGTGNDSAGDTTNGGRTTVVATINRGSGPDVAGANEGSTGAGTTAVAGVNPARATDVAPTNTTYDQTRLTTTTTRRASDDGGADDADGPPVPPPMDPSNRRGDKGLDAAAPVAMGGARSSGYDGSGAPADAPGEAAAVRAFEEANARPLTPAERTLLRGLAERFAPAAGAVGASGWAWVAAAAYEAVEAGSAYVAPRRLREILARWEREGFPDAADGPPAAAAPDPAAPARGRSAPASPASPRAPGERGARGTGGRARGGGAAGRGVAPVERLGEGPDLPLPHGHGARRTWAFAVGLLAGAIERGVLAELVAGTAIVGYRDGEVTVAVPEATRAERLATVYGELVARKLGEAMRRPVRVAFLVPDGAGDAAPGGLRVAGGTQDAPPAAGEPAGPPPSFLVAECGLPSGQVWAAVLAAVEAEGRVSRANVDAWLRPTRLLGRDGGGGAGAALVVGAPHALARDRIAARFLPELRAAVAAVVGVPLPLEVVVGAEWRASAVPADPDQSVRGA